MSDINKKKRLFAELRLAQARIEELTAQAELTQQREDARRLPIPVEGQSEAAHVCAEAYQVLGSMVSDLGLTGTEQTTKLLDNLSQARMVHRDILPWGVTLLPRHDLHDLRAAICAMGIIEKINGYDVIRRDSVIELINRRIKPPG
jgi:hypothetical protein